MGLTNELLAERDALRKEVEQLRADLAATRAALEAVEWATYIVEDEILKYCPWCDSDAPHHAPDCARQIALGLAKKTEDV